MLQRVCYWAKFWKVFFFFFKSLFQNEKTTPDLSLHVTRFKMIRLPGKINHKLFCLLAVGQGDPGGGWSGWRGNPCSTTQARRCLTLEIRRDPVISPWYGRRHKWSLNEHIILLTFKLKSMIGSSKLHSCLRPYHGEITGSRLISKVKHRRAWVVLGWVTTWEVRVL